MGSTTPDVPEDDPRFVRRYTQTIKVSIRNLRTDRFITAGYAFDVDIPRLDDLPTLDGLYVAPRTLRRGDAYTAQVYTPRPTENQRRRASTDYDDSLQEYTAIIAADPNLTGAPRDFLQLPVLRRGSGPDLHARRHVRRPAGADRARGARAHLRARAPARRRRGHARGLRPARAQLPRRQRPLHLQRDAAARGAHARRLPVRRTPGLLPAVLGRDGAAAADGGHPGARDDRLQHRRDRHQDRRVRRARLRRAFLGRGLLPRLRLGDVRPDAGRQPGAQPARGRRRQRRHDHRLGAAHPGRPARRARRRRRRSPRSRARGGTTRCSASPSSRSRRSRCSACAAGATARRPRSPSSSARSSAPVATPVRAPRCTRSSCASSSTRPRPPATSVRCARAATATSPRGRRARSAAACGPSSDVGEA